MIFYITACITLLKLLGVACVGANPIALATLLIVGTVFRCIGFSVTLFNRFKLDV